MPSYYNNPKVMVYPYRQCVGGVAVRNFIGWTASHEISFNGGNTMNTCNGPLPAYLGEVQFRVF